MLAKTRQSFVSYLLVEPTRGAMVVLTNTYIFSRYVRKLKSEYENEHYKPPLSLTTANPRKEKITETIPSSPQLTRSRSFAITF